MTNTLQHHSDDPVFSDAFDLLENYARTMPDHEFNQKVKARLVAGHKVVRIVRPSGHVSVVVQNMTTGEVHEGVFTDDESSRQAAWLVVCMIDRLA